MKIAFLCTSLAPGRDGVGDYCRQLAAACAEAGDTCRLIALNDRHLAASARESPAVLRLSSRDRWSSRAAALHDELAEFQPDWVSWQIVAYGFDPKGIMPAAAARLAQAARPWRQHAMLHELWLGLAAGSRWRARLLGEWQRRRLLGFLRRLRPVRLHTSNRVYQTVLQRHGWAAEPLPLFGNIPPVEPRPVPALDQRLAAALGPGPRWLAVMFGTIHADWPAADTFAWLREAAALAQRRVAILTLGRGGPQRDAIFAPLASRFPELPVIALDAAAPEDISRVLQLADFGLSSHPWALLEKSGSTVAMLEHGLPVLVSRDEWRLRGAPHPAGPIDPLLRRLAGFAPADLPAWLATRRPPASRLSGVACKFLTDLGEPVQPAALLAS